MTRRETFFLCTMYTRVLYIYTLPHKIVLKLMVSWLHQQKVKNSCYYSYRRSWHTNEPYGSFAFVLTPIKASFARSCKQKKFCLRAQLQ